MDKRRFQVIADGRMADGAPLNVETVKFANDAGAAWIDFSDGFIGMAWNWIIVREVVHDEGEKEEGKR